MLTGVAFTGSTCLGLRFISHQRPNRSGTGTYSTFTTQGKEQATEPLALPFDDTDVV